VERTAVLIHLVDATQENVGEAYRTVRTELEAYGGGLGSKTELLALNKIDALDAEAREAAADALEAEAGRRPLLVSGVSGEGVRELLRAAYIEVRKLRSPDRRDEEIQDDEWRP
jgi:GTP-binding protein